jgi:Ca-activated chloride channel homolog
MKKALILICICALTSLAFGQQNLQPDVPVIRMDVNLVLAHATVLDKNGQSISDLGQQAFSLFVDGAPQKITLFRKDDSPVTAGIVVDNSASMAPKGPEVLAAALAFARASNPQDQMFVVHFSDKVRFGLPPEVPFTGNISTLEEGLSVFKPEGTTALYDAIEMAASQLHKANLERKVLLVISDGGDNSSKTHLEEVLKLARASGYLIYCIGIYDSTDRDRNPQVLQELADVTGGKAYFPQELQEVTSIAVEIARDIRKQYTLGFDGPHDGHYHRITVTAHDARLGELDVRTRAGYLAPPPSSEQDSSKPEGNHSGQ